MARYIQRPENALKRANEFIDVGKPARALDTLQEVFRNKKWTYTWSETVIEPIMFKYLELCVELKKSHIAKEGLFQYRNMFQLVNVGSLENVIRGYLKMAEERTEQAEQQSIDAIMDVYDLDNLATPESILMSAVCGEDAQDRSDRTILLPWVKFLWESYCQCLELLRINSHCENLYHDIARMAFSFCLQYNRKMEFRKLSEKLRKHLEDICKVSTQSANVSISKPETQQLNLDTRLYQLDSAIQMELWQEAYKAIEDIHGLMMLSKKTPVPKTMANYYQKLAMVFWKAGNQLFHAAALLKFLQLSKELKKTITPEELQRLASLVLVATLSIPLPSAHPEFDRFIETDKSPLEKAQRLAVLLGLQQPPTRASLLKDIIRLNVVQLAAPICQNLYKWLEVDFNPLNLCNNVQTVIDYINQDPQNPLIQYIEALQDVTLVRLVRQICQVYQSIEFSRFLELAKFANTYKLERILVDCVRHNDMQITIDHKNKCVHFGTDLSESQREDHHDGPTLQSMPSEQVRSQLVNMSIVLHRAIAAINPNRKKSEREKLRSQMVQNYHDNKEKEHQNILIRQKLIEDRKEYIERMNTEREEEEYRRQEELQRQQKLAEQKRLEQEMEEREKKRVENELQKIKSHTVSERIKEISRMSHGQQLLKIIETKGTVDPDEIAREEQNALIKERKELQAKLKSQEKKIDYLERAKRAEEIPLIEKFLEEKAVQDKVFWENQEKTRIENAIAERQNAVAQQDRLKRLYPDRDAFLDRIKAERKTIHAEKLQRFTENLEEERKKRMAQRIIDRREQRRKLWLQEKEEEKQRKLEEIRKIKEEKERVEREKRAKELEEMQQKKQEEAERKQKIEEDALRKMEERKNKAAMEAREREPASRPDKPEMNAWRTPSVREEKPRGEPREPRGEPRGERGEESSSQPKAPENVWRSRTVQKGEETEKWRREETGRDKTDHKRGDEELPPAPAGRYVPRTTGDDRRDDFKSRDNRDDRYAPRAGDDRDRRDDFKSRDNRDDRFGSRGGDDRGGFRRSGDDRRGDDRRGGMDRRAGDRDDRRGGDRGDRDDRRPDDRRSGGMDRRDRGGDRDDRRGGDRDDRRGGDRGADRRGDFKGRDNRDRDGDRRGGPRGGDSQTDWRARDENKRGKDSGNWRQAPQQQQQQQPQPDDGKNKNEDSEGWIKIGSSKH